MIGGGLVRARKSGTATKLDGAVTKGARDRGTIMGVGMRGMNNIVALVAKGRALSVAIGSSRGVVAIFTEWEGSDGRSELDALMGSTFRSDMLKIVARLTQNAAMGDAEDDGSGCGTAVANRPYAYQTGHVLDRWD